ncbi:MAG: cobaltochelatase subunit CobN [Geminicoccaceae bacterium]|nr:cobaltochelatase subunit CobN [Geminicoccaceae bacterium]
MHLLTAAAATPDDATEAVDLGQDPAPIVVLSAADTELTMLSAAAARLPEGAPSIRLANYLKLAHPLSVDLYAEKTLAHARIVVARLLGGRAYWRYGVEQLEALARERGVMLALLPGDPREDPDLAAASTVPKEARARLMAYLANGGPHNADGFLAFAAGLIGQPLDWQEPRPLPRAGLYWPGSFMPDLAAIRARWRHEGAPVLLLFYRALVQAGDLAAVDAVVAGLIAEGLDPLPLHVSSLKDKEAEALLEAVIGEARPGLALNLTAFAVGRPGVEAFDPLARAGIPVLQLVAASGGEAAWAASPAGLSGRDLAMSVALPELDGRVLACAVAFKEAGGADPRTQCSPVRQRPRADRVRHAARLAKAWIDLAAAPRPERRIALILANYPNRDGRLGNGVGLDTPASAVGVLGALATAGYRVDDVPRDSADLMRRLTKGPTNSLDDRPSRTGGSTLPLDAYMNFFKGLPGEARTAVLERWGEPASDPHVEDGAFRLALHRHGNVWLGIQPARGYNVDPTATYHSPDLVPPHGYLAFYACLRTIAQVHAIVHMGKHGNLEWLPGKALALSEACWPEAALGPTPHLYPFIVNDPGEGAQAKRRASAVIVDHLTPPLARAGSYGELQTLERLVDEHYEASRLDPRRLELLRTEIKDLTHRLGLERDLGLDPSTDETAYLSELDNHLCELKELQIRDGLHVFGRSPEGKQRAGLLQALVRLPRGRGKAGDRGLTQALACDLGLGFDPLKAEPASPWLGPRPQTLQEVAADSWRSTGDAVERLELLAFALIEGHAAPDPAWTATAAVLDHLRGDVAPRLDASGGAEMDALLAGLDGRRVAPGPSGAPTRGRLDVLPTGRNFYSVDPRAVPTPTAWALGWRSAETLIEHHLQNEGDWPRRLAVSAWGTANMRTGGDDVAQVLAFMGCRPVWDDATGRVAGVEVMPLSVLGRPRIDVTLRVSGFFRDAFPEQIALIDDAVRAVAAQADEPDDMNPLKAAAAAEAAGLVAGGAAPEAARRQATLRVFGSKPGAYGAGLQALIDEGGWEGDADLAEGYLAWSAFAYGRGVGGEPARGQLETCLKGVEIVLHNQDNREHDLLDSDDYYQFQGGLAVSVRALKGGNPTIYHADHSRPETPRVRRLKEEIGRVVRGRAANPKWIAGVMRHGYKGAFEIAATVDYLFAYAATAAVVEDHHFEALFDAYLADEEVRGFIADANPAALAEIEARFQEAVRRGLWRPRRNDVAARLGMG